MTNREEGLKKYLAIPKDLTDASIDDKAGILTLHFIGYVAKPKGISDDVYKKCVEAFNSHRGKMEWEEAAVKKVLEKETKDAHI